MDYKKFFSKITNRRNYNLIRQLNDLYLSYPNGINFGSANPNGTKFPVEDISLTYKHNNLIKLNKSELSTAFQLGSSQGHGPLLEKWKEFQKTWHTPMYNNWDVAFTSGSLDACNKIFEMILDENEPILLQTLTYPGILGGLLPLLPDIIEINQDADGIIPEEITKACEQRLATGKPMPKLLYINPTGTNPTGAVLSETRRRKVYEVAQKYNFLIVEADPYYFVHFLDKQPTSFFSLDTDGRVIRLDSFKIMFPGIRVGIVTAHKDIVEKLIMHLDNSTVHTSALSQMLVYKLFQVWEPQQFEEYFKDIQKFYRERRDIILTLAEKHLTGLAEWYVPEGGFFLWVKLFAIDNALDLVINKFVPQGVFAIPGNAFNCDPSKPSKHLRFCFSFSSPEEMDKGISLMAKIIREEAAKKK
ncbi:kynurenine/alpha-aminoadipate aminotransferase, mitochondrial-like isoform X2 [Nylanderia fulva]|uniref:kynurenine/alpha-aminoadipate aminotransferase, mitochondrial-like isoform X2 n=1 Tax=Nylanderia fulva TaxID=613905 RepID=UPI0010FB8D73|nr:kynurenine/alpha-aminoadipate aminotransferase, mitochondrial-like isoform X2 [Nylanderia fulva]